MHSATLLSAAILLPLAACATPSHRPASTGPAVSDAYFADVQALNADSSDRSPMLHGTLLSHETLLAGEPILGERLRVSEVPAAAEQLEDELVASEDWLAQGPPPPRPQTGGSSRWRKGAALLQGYFGASINNLERNGGGVRVEADDVELPSIGGGGQWKLAGDRIDIGLEGMLGFNWRASSTAFVVGGGGAAVAVDVDMFLMDLYGGPFASMFLGDSLRVYAGAGPMMQWAFYDERGFSSQDGSGFGVGYYARTGLDFELGRGSYLGFGVRWSDSSIDVGGNLGDVDLDGFLWMVTFSHFY